MLYNATGLLCSYRTEHLWTAGLVRRHKHKSRLWLELPKAYSQIEERHQICQGGLQEDDRGQQPTADVKGHPGYNQLQRPGPNDHQPRHATVLIPLITSFEPVALWVVLLVNKGNYLHNHPLLTNNGWLGQEVCCNWLACQFSPFALQPVYNCQITAQPDLGHDWQIVCKVSRSQSDCSLCSLKRDSLTYGASPFPLLFTQHVSPASGCPRKLLAY